MGPTKNKKKIFITEHVHLQSETNETVQGKYKWKKELKTDFIDRIEDSVATEKLSSLNGKIHNCTNPDEIKYCLSELVDILETAAKPFFKKKQTK